MNRDTKIVIVFMVAVVAILASMAVWQSTSEMGQRHDGNIADLVDQSVENFTRGFFESSSPSSLSAQP